MGVSSRDYLYRTKAHGTSTGPKKYNPTFYTKRKRFEYPPPYPITPPHNTRLSWKEVPPKPKMTIHQTSRNKVTLIWNLNLTPKIAEIQKYELFICQETDRYPCSSLWIKKNLGALMLPMGCYLEDFAFGYTYYFALRAVDIHESCAPFAVVKIKV